MAASIDSVSLDCSSSTITINGTSLPSVFSVTIDGTPSGFTLVSSSSTQAVLRFVPFRDGEYCIAANEGNLQTSDADDLQTSDSSDLYAAAVTGWVCNTFSCAIHVTEMPVNIWTLHRFDMKVRQEETA